MRPIKTKKQFLPYEDIVNKKKESSKDIISSQKDLNAMSLPALKQQFKKIKGQITQKQFELSNAQKMYRIQGFKNQKLKEEVIEISRHCQLIRKKLALDLYNKNKQSKDSPLFYNQVGLCPFQLMLIDQSKHQSFQTHICMVCFSDIVKNSIVINLPCSHLFHKQCAVQNLLYSKNCPGCGAQINISNYVQSKMKILAPNKKEKMSQN